MYLLQNTINNELVAHRNESDNNFDLNDATIF